MSSTVQPVERQDIHKACRTIEALLAVLNDYCEAAGAFAAIQKKLSKALRDAAGLKTNAQFAGQFILILHVVSSEKLSRHQPMLLVRVPSSSRSWQTSTASLQSWLRRNPIALPQRSRNGSRNWRSALFRSSGAQLKPFAERGKGTRRAHERLQCTYQASR